MASTAALATREGSADVFSLAVAALAAAWDDGQLHVLLERRPDLATPPPRSLVALAQRAAEPASAEAAYHRLDRSAQQVVEVLALLPAPVPLDRLAHVIAPDVDPADLDGPLTRLEAMALAVRTGESVVLNPGLARLRHRAGLGAPAATVLGAQPAHELVEMCRRLGLEAGRDKSSSVKTIVGCLADPEQVRRLLTEAPAGAVELAEQAAHGAHVGVRGGIYALDDRSPAGWLARRGLLVAVDWYQLAMPAEVGVALRGGSVFEHFTPDEPPVRTAPIDVSRVDGAGAEHALRTTADVVAMLEEWAVHPPRLLKDGGVGVREVRRLAKLTDRTERDISRIIDIAVAAGLVWVDSTSDAALPTSAFDDWVCLDPASRWERLVSGWLAADFHPSLAGAIGAKDKPIPPLLPRGLHEEAIAQRRTVLEAMAQVPAGAAASRAALGARAGWASPDLWDAGPGPAEVLVEWVFDECELLGIWAGGSLTTAGRRVAAGDLAAASAVLAERAPKTVHELVLQADLTAVAAGALASDVAKELELMADVESRGAATVYRFSEQSLRRAFDAGRSSDDVGAFLDRHAARGVPQALAYLVADVGRRHGKARVGPARSYVRSDDGALLAELAQGRATAKLRFRPLAPTVLVTEAEPAAVLTALRSAGYLPAQEDATGALVVSRPPARRAPARQPPRLRPRALRPAPALDLPGIVKALRNGPRTASPKAVPRTAPRIAPAPLVAPPPAPSPPSLFEDGPVRPAGIAHERDAIAELLEQAWVEDWAVRVSYTNAKGAEHQINIAILDRSGAQVIVEVPPSYHRRTLNLARVRWARVLTEAEEDQIL